MLEYAYEFIIFFICALELLELTIQYNLRQFYLKFMRPYYAN